MPDVCLYLQVHQPHRLRRYRVFDIGTSVGYFDEGLNSSVLRRVAEHSYEPTNALLAELVDRSDGRFRLALSLSGVVMEQMAAEAPRALESFQTLVDGGGVELLGETYYHSLAALTDPEEFRAQAVLHWTALRQHFGVRPRVFRHTELLYSDWLGALVAELGYLGVLVEGTSHVLGTRSPGDVYALSVAPGLRLLARHTELSDDIAFRFGDRSWAHWPLTADSLAARIAEADGEVVNLFLDYETFGEHHAASTGIRQLLAELPAACERRGVGWVTPTELTQRQPVAALSVPRITSWADQERDDSAWLGNKMQRAAHWRLYDLKDRVAAARDPELRESWRRLTTSDHVYYMSTKLLDDGGVHAYFSPFGSPYDAFIAFMNVIQDLEQRLEIGRESATLDLEQLAYAGMAVAS